MNVLVACEESQRVCIEFRKKGHDAFSCDIQEPSGGHPEWHILGDVLAVLNPYDTGHTDGILFNTMDGTEHFVKKWDLLIAHPPCTYLSNAGAARLYKRVNGKSYIERDRFEKGMNAKDFFMMFLNCNCDHIAVENPVPSRVYRMPPYSQIIQPYEHGDPYQKKTCLWIKGLPEIKPTNKVDPICSWVSGGSKRPDGSPRDNKGTRFRDSRIRSKTFPGIAKAMAEQWG